jgi:precorrin-4 C11-methyltransferase
MVACRSRLLLVDHRKQVRSAPRGEKQSPGTGRTPRDNSAGKRAGKVYFIGAGPGDPELLTLRGKRLIESADLVLYADSLVSPEICRYASPNAEIIGTSDQTLESIVHTMVGACRAGRSVARVHSGDPSIYGALHEQLAVLEREDIPYEIVPGVSSAFAAAAELRAELTVPEVAQTVIFTRLPSRTAGVPNESLRDLASHRATMAIFLSVTAVERVVEDLRAGGYGPDTPAAVVYRATWPEQLVLRGRLDELAGLTRQAGLKRQALILVGPALDPAIRQLEDTPRSGLYNPSHNHIFRSKATPQRRGRAAVRRSADGPLALIAASHEGARLAARLGKAWPAAARHILTPYLAEGGPGAREIAPPLSAAVAELFAGYRGLVFFLPVGAVVRLIAPHLVDKSSDPGVIAVDDGGRFAISLLSGHSGGGNALAEQVAAALGAMPVMTTAVERQGQISPELIGQPFGWRLEATREALLRASVALANGEAIGVYDDCLEVEWLPRPRRRRHFRSLARLASSGVEAAIVVSDRQLPEPVAGRYVVWRPRRLVAGIGCSSGAPLDEIEALLRSSLEGAGLAPGGLRLLATLDRKLSEPGLRQLAVGLQLELKGYSQAELNKVVVPNPSAVVRRAVGTSSVAEAAALLASEGGALLAPKRASQHATVALAERPPANTRARCTRQPYRKRRTPAR